MRGWNLHKSAYMSTRHAQAPAAPLSSFLSSSPLSLVRPRRRLPRPDRRMLPPARAGCVKAGPLFSGPPSGSSAFTRPSTTAGLMGSVDCSCPLLLIRHRVSARYSDQECAFGESCYEVHGACDVRINLISGSSDPAYQGAACMDDRAGVDGAHLSNGRLASADLRCGHTATHPTRPTHPTGGVGTQRTVNVIA